jgi:hypothetical protein
MTTDLMTCGDEDRIIQGQIIKMIDGRNTVDGEPFPADKKLIALGTKIAAQRWKDQRPAETIVQKPGGPPIDIDELNAGVPKDQWEAGLNNQPCPPWQLNYVLYLLDPDDGSTFTVLNSTAGMRIAFEHLTDRIKYMRALRGASVVPVIPLGSKVMKTRFGTKMRPEFRVLDWRDLSNQVSPPETKVLGQPVAPITAKEIIDDDFPENLGGSAA